MNMGTDFFKFEAPAVFRRGFFISNFARKGGSLADQFPNLRLGSLNFL